MSSSSLCITLSSIHLSFSSTNLRLLKLLNDVIEKIKEDGGDEFQKKIILNFIKEKGSSLLENIPQYEHTDESTEEESEGTEEESEGTEEESEGTEEKSEGTEEESEVKRPITEEMLKEICVEIEKKMGPLGLPDLIEKINEKSEFKDRKNEWTPTLNGMVFTGKIFQTTKKIKS